VIDRLAHCYKKAKNSVNIAGATAATYQTPATTLADSGTAYRAVVTNAFGTATSNAATLSVGTNTAPVATIRALGVVTPQTSGNNTYQFVSWSDGGAATHNIQTPVTNTAYTATYQLVPLPAPTNLTVQVIP
jgi:hypothetical protein